MNALPTVYLARMDVDPAMLLDFMTWYTHQHGPDLIAAGFYSVQGYQCRAGEPYILNVYEIPGSDIFYSEEYTRRRTPEHDRQRPAILAGVSNRSNTPYEQVATLGVELPARPWADGDRTGRIDATTVTTLGLAAPESADDAVLAWFRQGWASALAGSGFLRARLCRRAGRPHPARVSTQPRWLVLVEWPDLASAADAEPVELAAVAAAEVPFTEVAYNRAVRVLDLRN
ncbi:hypothetical protein [Micromonospora cathayae]|uniref:NIPSNAP protein n=1 Tax=Micromonospora cathayae TaxID=3028804 RepID=A0ABY7ZLS0_9ACTN|nr:hypothetical protein [Micromonospora sp. HUAS 3]WDZ83803.1 hypothetical protein PVK37_25570 [Micromonospora sp. HUAS 3]